jgi:hypothetical protein
LGSADGRIPSDRGHLSGSLGGETLDFKADLRSILDWVLPENAFHNKTKGNGIRQNSRMPFSNFSEYVLSQY